MDPAAQCAPAQVSAGESCGHLPFSPFSTFSLPGWEPGRVFTFIPLSLAAHIAYLPQL